MATEYYRVQHLRGTSAQWLANDLVIAEGEIAVELGDTAMRIKIGDGARLFSELPYTSGQDDVARSDIQTLEIDLAAVAGEVTALDARTDTLESDMAAVEAGLAAAIATPAGTVAGAVLYYDGATWQATPAGDAGRVLTAAGAGPPSWQPQAVVLVYRGRFDPTAGPEYPSAPAANDLWNLAAAHTWTTGELTGETGAPGDFIAFNGSVWSLIPLGGGSSIEHGTFAAPAAVVVRHLRSDTAGAVPPAGVEREGVLAVNRADRQIFAIDAAGTGRAMLAVRLFDAAAGYAAGDYAVQANRLYRALTAVTPGAFVATQWAPVGSIFVTGDGIAPAAPGPAIGDMWFDTGTLALKVWAIVGGTPGWQAAGGSYLPLTGGAITGNLSISGTLAYGKAAALASGFDLDGLTVPGAYDVADPVNGPEAGSANWLVEVLRYSGDAEHVAQRATKLAPLTSSPTPFYRSRTAAGWLAWIAAAAGSGGGGTGAPIRITASTSWTPPAGCVRFKVQLQAPGGGGGGANGTASNESAQGAGGGGGCYIEDVLEAGAGPYTITIGAAGTGGASAGGSGGPGGNVQFTDGATLDLIAGGGGGATGMNGIGGSGGSTGATGGEVVSLAGASAAVLVIPGGHGYPGRVISGLNAGPAKGGDGQLGRGRFYRGVGSGVGDPGSGYGGGGGGGRAGSTTSNYAGGAGAPGVVIITPYF